MFLLEIKLIYTILDASCLIGISTNLRKQQSDDKGIGQLKGYIVVEFFTLWIILLSFTYWQSFTIFMLSMSRENKNWFMVIEDIVLAPSWLLIKTRRKDLVKTVKVWMYRRFPAPKTSWNLLRYVSRWERTAFNYNPKEINIRKQILQSKNQMMKFVCWKYEWKLGVTWEDVIFELYMLVRESAKLWASSMMTTLFFRLRPSDSLADFSNKDW